MRTPAKILILLSGAVLVIGAVASFDIFPREWVADGPQWIRWIVGSCFLLFSLVVVVGYVSDSGLIQRILRSKQE
ncbi:hypothetical protein OVA24_14105 [Luteolibacter sp. SL250]|uniref:hypothetical protein n=1 Tax=Luteolibacter sp. SL250 TaxID=2995170 RepID=UPI00226D4FE4|nr:hypothetical protein [Luteolibacter sp. SL250]WAC18367.1 hypothetical protein OVA24_14105 [Luteolibacter sp. SL250]